MFAISSNAWEETITWSTKPPVDGDQLASFGRVVAGRWHEVALGATSVPGNGLVSFALDSQNVDGARWSTREATRPPRLLVDVARVPGLVLDGLSRVAEDYVGSSDPTFFGSNHRLAMTAGGRLLTVYGRHATGVQLAWRDPGSGWQTLTRGDMVEGLLLSGSGSGDWPASIAVAKDPSGEEHAWVTYAGWSPTSTAPLRLRRLSDLDDPAGPVVGPSVTVPTSGGGNERVDLAFEVGPDGSARGCLTWLQHTTDATWDQSVTWFTDLTTDVPSFEPATVVIGATASGRYGTLTRTPAGMSLLIRNISGQLQMFRHQASAPLSSWQAGATGMGMSPSSVPSAAALYSGEVLAAVETATTVHNVKVQRFSADGMTATIVLELTGYRTPTIATDGTSAWLVMGSRERRIRGLAPHDGNRLGRHRPGGDRAGRWRQPQLAEPAPRGGRATPAGRARPRDGERAELDPVLSAPRSDRRVTSDPVTDACPGMPTPRRGPARR